MIQHSDSVVLHFLLWNWWGIVGIWSIYDPFRRIPKQHVAGLYSPILLVQASGHQFKYWSTFHALNGAAKRWSVYGFAKHTPTHARARVSASFRMYIRVTCDLRRAVVWL